MADNLLKSVTNCLILLEVLAGSERELGVSDVAKKLNISTSSAHRLLLTLEARGFVEQNTYNDKYRSGMKIVSLSSNILKNTNIITKCRPYLQELNRVTNETSLLAIYNQGEIIYVDKAAESSRSLELTSIIGLKRPAYSTANGKVLLAFLPEKELESYFLTVDLAPLTPYTITDKDKLKQNLAKIRITELGEDYQEAQEGLVCFSAPIRNAYGRVVAAMSVSTTPSRIDYVKDDLVSQLKRVTEKTSLACGWQRPIEEQAF